MTPTGLDPAEPELELRESAERLQRYVEELDVARERALVIRDEIQIQLAEALNDRMYPLAIIGRMKWI